MRRAKESRNGKIDEDENEEKHQAPEARPTIAQRFNTGKATEK